jgi:hypothetical protein
LTFGQSVEYKCCAKYSTLPPEKVSYFSVVPKYFSLFSNDLCVGWAPYTAALPADHHVPWGKFHTSFCTHHLYAGLLRSKPKEFLDLDQGNHSIFNYTRQLNTLAQYGSYHVDTDEKKANLYREGLTIQHQDCLVQSPNLSYNDLAPSLIKR